MYGYTVAQGLVHVLKACGDNLTRENVMKQAASIKDLELGGLLPGIKVNTSATDFAPISAASADEVQGRDLGSVRRSHQRRRRRLTLPSELTDCQGNCHGTGPCAHRAQGLFLEGHRRSCHKSRTTLRKWETWNACNNQETCYCLGCVRSVCRNQQRRARAEEIRQRRHRYRDQDRQHHALQRTRFRLRRDRQDRRGLLQEDQRRGRHQRPQDQLHQL